MFIRIIFCVNELYVLLYNSNLYWWEYQYQWFGENTGSASGPALCLVKFSLYVFIFHLLSLTSKTEEIWGVIRDSNSKAYILCQHLILKSQPEHVEICRKRLHCLCCKKTTAPSGKKPNYHWMHCHLRAKKLVCLSSHNNSIYIN